QADRLVRRRAQDDPWRQQDDGSRRQSRRQGDRPYRGDNLEHDGAGAASTKAPQRRPEEAHRPRLRHHGPRREPVDEELRGDAQAHEAHGKETARQGRPWTTAASLTGTDSLVTRRGNKVLVGSDWTSRSTSV